MGLFRRRRQQETDPFGGTGQVAGAGPAPAPAPQPVPVPAPVAGSALTIDARGVPGLRADVMRLAMSGGTSDQIMEALRQHGVNLPAGVPITMMPGAPGMPAPAAATGEDAATRLRKLQELRSGALITEEEFQAQRARILEEL